MKTSENGLNFIENLEGCKLTSYKCPAGIWTIGIGSTRYADGSAVKQGQTLANKQAALDLLANTIAPFEHAVNAIGVTLNQNQFDALVSLCYNIGASNFASSTLVKLLKSGADKTEIADQFLRWDKANGKSLAGLTHRRQVERTLFLS